ncbi:hypothetical protein FOTG_08924 [Fusarium oxysporum f. sp. vasinfectum 25433]|uniref:Uncharacterized protein n=1 Tax=Fusarium oxysporum f. sp. vasinfectum 25433 TaxID=1089449 RepID=X0MUD3_FUSOX|nr:hypothetical protein FOTG_08924 [Fusarium oxysporum f. sp. vasinfectum 25433]
MTRRSSSRNQPSTREIWSGWIAWPSGPIIREIDLGDETTLEVSFIYWVKGHTGNPNTDDVWKDDNSAWFHYIEQCGIATELQYTIMDPLFRDMRLTDTCIGWLRDTIEMRYEGLRNIQRASAERERALGHQGTSDQRPRLESEAFCRPVGDMQHTNTEPSGSASGGRHTLSGPSIIERFTVLYKAMDQARTDGLFDSKGALNRISVLRSIPPTDFSENKTMYCFTPDYNLARKHAAWVKRRGPYAVIVKIAVQDSVITAMDPPDIQCAFWPNSNWWELIWHCRTETISKETVDYGRAALIIKTIANGPNAYYHQRSPGELITEACVVRVRGPNKGGDRAAVQYVFSFDYEGRKLLEDQARNTIKIFSFDTCELEIWAKEIARFKYLRGLNAIVWRARKLLTLNLGPKYE